MEKFITLPNGCRLVPGGRIRLLRSQLWEIPESVVNDLGLLLDDHDYSYDTEVIIWPAQ